VVEVDTLIAGNVRFGLLNFFAGGGGGIEYAPI